MAENIRVMEKEMADKEEMIKKLLDRLKGMESLAVNSKHGNPPVSGSAAAGEAPAHENENGGGSAAAQVQIPSYCASSKIF